MSHQRQTGVHNRTKISFASFIDAFKKYSLSLIPNVVYFVLVLQSTCSSSGDGLYEGFDWLSEMLTKNRRTNSLLSKTWNYVWSGAARIKNGIFR